MSNVIMSVFARVCADCGVGMNAGHLWGGEATSCVRCANKEYTHKELVAMYDNDEQCYTEWDQSDCDDMAAGGFPTAVSEFMDTIMEGTPFTMENCPLITADIKAWFRESGHSRIPSDYSHKWFITHFPKPWGSERVKLVHAYQDVITDIAEEVMKEDK